MGGAWSSPAPSEDRKFEHPDTGSLEGDPQVEQEATTVMLTPGLADAWSNSPQTNKPQENARSLFTSFLHHPDDYVNESEPSSTETEESPSLPQPVTVPESIPEPVDPNQEAKARESERQKQRDMMHEAEQVQEQIEETLTRSMDQILSRVVSEQRARDQVHAQLQALQSNIQSTELVQPPLQGLIDKCQQCVEENGLFACESLLRQYRHQGVSLS